MENIDELLKTKEMELKEVQALKQKSLEQKLNDTFENLNIYSQRLQELTVINNAKDLEISEIYEKNRKLKQILEETSTKLSFLAEERDKYHDKLLEKDENISYLQKSLDNILDEKSILLNKINKNIQNHQEELKRMSEIQLNLGKKNEDLIEKLKNTVKQLEINEEDKKREILRNKENTDDYIKKQRENELLLENYKTENISLKTTNEMISANLNNFKEKLMKKKNKYVNIHEKYEELEFKHRQLLDENNYKILQIQQKNEQNMKNFMKNAEIKDIQISSLIEEKTLFQQKSQDYERQINEKTSEYSRNLQNSQQKINDLLMALQTKELEFNKLKQEKTIEIERISKKNEFFMEKTQNFEKNLRFLQQKNAELDKENALLIEEVVMYRKQDTQLQLPAKQTLIPTKISKEIFRIEDFREKTQEKPEKMLKSPKNDKYPDRKNMLNDELEVHSMLFSEDMGPATPLRISPNHFKKSNFLSKSTEIELKRRINELEIEKNDYKNIMENLAEEMQNIKNKLQLSQQLKEDNVLRIQSLERSIEAEKVNSEEKDRKIENFDKLLKTTKAKLAKLIDERSRLIEISQCLQAKVRGFEDDDSNDETTLDFDDDNKYSKKIRFLSEKLEILENDIKKYKEIEGQKDLLIERLRNKIIIGQKNPLVLEEFERIEKGDIIEGFKERVNELQKEITKELKVEGGKAKISSDRGVGYVKNSEKETESQRKSEEKLKKTGNSKMRARNYNIKN